jgi:chromosome segregation ATPase
MSDKIWTPDSDPLADITMKLETTKFNKLQVESKISQLKLRILTMSKNIETLESNLNYLSSHKAKIISLPEYKIITTTIKALKSEKARSLEDLAEVEENMDSIEWEIKKLQSVTKIELGKVLRFKRPNDEENKG